MTPETASAPAGGPRGAFELFGAKLAPPPRPGQVERTALISRLSRGHNRRFVSIVAPPGSGKTTALAQWAERGKRPFAWVSLDRRDNDPVVLLSYLAEALSRGTGVDPAVLEGLTAASLWTRALPRLGVALASLPEPFVLVLDDVHELEDPECLDALAAVLGQVPQGSQLVLCGRTEARLGLAKLRADGELLELGRSALAMNDREAHALLTAAGLDVTETEARALNERAEGWAAGLYLAALSLEAGDSSLASFGGDDRFVTDYLRSEQLARVKPAELEFLLRTAVLDRMSGPLCDAVLEARDSTALLEQLEHDNLFVIALDHQRTWFRYHHLFREMLEAELRRREPELLTALNARAGAWFEANGEPEIAIEYLAAAGDTDGVARLVTACAFPYYRSGRVTTVERWLALFDEPAKLDRHPAIAVFGVWLHALRGRPDVAERWALSLDTPDPQAEMPDGSPFVAWAATVRALLCQKGVEQMELDAELAMSGLAAASPWRPAALVLHAVAVLLSGDLERAELGLERAAEAAAAGGAVWAGVVARCELALLSLERGDLAAAESELAQAEALIDEASSPEYVLTAIVLAVTAKVALARGQNARARAMLVSAQRFRPMLTHALALVRGADPARAREGSSRALGHPRRDDPLPRGGRRPSSTAGLGTLVGAGRRGPREARHRCRPVLWVGVDPHGSGAPPAAVPDDPSLLPRDRRAALRLAQHGQDAGDLRLPQARRFQPERGDRASDRARARRRLTRVPRLISPAPDDVAGRRKASNGRGDLVDEYKLTLRRLALRDDRFIEALLSEDRANVTLSGIDQRSHALLRIAALIAVDAAPPSYMNDVEAGLRAGASYEEIVGTLIAVIPIVGVARVVSAAPKLGLALGYDVAEALELVDG